MYIDLTDFKKPVRFFDLEFPMKLSDVEFRAMDTWWRKWGQEHFELPLFRRLVA